ncbi:hypothetical protein MXB_778 [Myxobolus squamalis]|nr:hypothetical protein MXB_778 [Myxobolus squamalis]
MLKILSQVVFFRIPSSRQPRCDSVFFLGSPINPLSIFGNHHIQQLLKGTPFLCIHLDIYQYNIQNCSCAFLSMPYRHGALPDCKYICSNILDTDDL